MAASWMASEGRMSLPAMRYCSSTGSSRSHGASHTGFHWNEIGSRLSRRAGRSASRCTRLRGDDAEMTIGRGNGPSSSAAAGAADARVAVAIAQNSGTFKPRVRGMRGLSSAMVRA